MAASGGAAAPFRLPAASGRALHVRDSSSVLGYAGTPAAARLLQAWLFVRSASGDQPALGPLPRLQTGMFSLLPPPTCDALISFLPRPGLGCAARHLRARQELNALIWADASWTHKSPLFPASWLAVVEEQVSGRALHVLASAFVLRSSTVWRGFLPPARTRFRFPCFVSDNGPVRCLLFVCWQA